MARLVNRLPLLNRTWRRSILPGLSLRLSSGEAYVAEKLPVEGENFHTVIQSFSDYTYTHTTGETEHLKLVHAINSALDTALETDSTAGTWYGHVCTAYGLLCVTHSPTCTIIQQFLEKMSDLVVCSAVLLTSEISMVCSIGAGRERDRWLDTIIDQT